MQHHIIYMLYLILHSIMCIKQYICNLLYAIHSLYFHQNLVFKLMRGEVKFIISW